MQCSEGAREGGKTETLLFGSASPRGVNRIGIQAKGKTDNIILHSQKKKNQHTFWCIFEEVWQACLITMETLSSARSFIVKYQDVYMLRNTALPCEALPGACERALFKLFVSAVKEACGSRRTGISTHQSRSSAVLERYLEPMTHRDRASKP